MITIEYHIQVQPNMTRTSRKEFCLRGVSGGSVCDRTAITAGATSFIVQYFPTIITGMSNLTLVHQLDVVAYCLTRDDLYMSITSPLICSSLVL